uniref:histidine kinase n=1 Tax=Chlorobium chlorochromatii (strain CaD3) TaxID=340177 RepID=Q3ATG3_CHLCH
MNAPHAKRFRAFFAPLTAMSLRNRIALYYTSATALLIALLLTTVYFAVNRVVYEHFDEELRHEVAETFGHLHLLPYNFESNNNAQFRNIDEEYRWRSKENNAKGYHPKPYKKRKRQVDAELMQLVTVDGEILAQSATLNNHRLTIEPKRQGMAFFTSTVGSSAVRQVQVPLYNRQQQLTGYLLIAMPLSNAMLVLRDLQEVLLLSFPMMLLILFALTRLIAGRSIRPIEKVITTAEQMSQSTLDQRIPLPRHRDELYRLSSTINALFDRMQDAFLREKQFTADASHELKTPLSVVKGTLEVLVRKPREREHYETRIHFCLQELNRMALMIDQLLMLARYESSTMQPHIETVPLHRHIEALIERNQAAATTRGITLCTTGTINATVAADAGMVDMMLENIVSNALKYSPSGTTITLSVQKNENGTSCTIQDQGIGIPPEKVRAVFERFYRVDEARSSATGGLGLGLSIVKKLADLQQVTIAVESEVGKGTTICLTFRDGGR